MKVGLRYTDDLNPCSVRVTNTSRKDNLLSCSFFIVGIEIILDNDSFQFSNINDIQTLGTKITPICATLTLAYLEENLYSNILHELRKQAISF